MNDKMEQAAKEAGYEIGHSEESHGEHSFGLIILVKMSNRKISHDDDWDTFYDAAKILKNGLETTSAKLDPKGPEMRESYRKQIEDIYKAAGVTAIFMEPLPNGYCSSPCYLNRPWFKVASSIGHVTIGWRKRVISIDWKDTMVKQGGEDLFPDENVTRWETGIHA